MNLRIPGWVKGQLVPGALYQYEAATDLPWSISINGKKVDAQMEKGFASIDRKWNPGDEVLLSLPMQLQFNSCREEVEANRGKLALSRGPLVYCAEAIDQKESPMRFTINASIDRDEIVTQYFVDGPLSKTLSISLPAKIQAESQSKDQSLKLIPYYAWNNRGDMAMRVWFPIGD